MSDAKLSPSRYNPPAANSITNAMLAENVVNTAELVDAAVTTAKLAANAVTKVWTGTLNGGASGNATSSTSLVDIHANLNLTINTSGGDILILLCANGATNATIAMLVDSTSYPLGTASNGSSSAYYSVSGNLLITGLAAGTHTIKPQFMKSGSGSAYFPYLNGFASIIVIELKR